MELNESELRTLIAKGEGLTIEFQGGLPLNEETPRTLCAFANTKGGHLLIGVGAGSEDQGPPHPKETQAELRRIGMELIAPPVDVQTTTTPYADRLVVVAHVDSSARKPHSVLRAGERPEPIVRSGGSNHIATGPTLGALGIGHRPAKPTDPLERRILEWIVSGGKKSRLHEVDVTSEVLCNSLNLGGQRVKRALVNLERDGYLVAYGSGKARIYTLT